MIWICENSTVTKFEGDIFEYKEMLKKRIARQKRKAVKLAKLDR